MKEKLIKLSDSYKSSRDKLIKKLEKPVKVLKKIFGWGIMISLFAGGMTILGYIFALCVGGELATSICVAIKQYVIPAVTYTSTAMVLFGIIIMYLSGQVALSAKKNKPTTPKKAAPESKPEESAAAPDASAARADNAATSAQSTAAPAEHDATKAESGNNTEA